MDSNFKTPEQKVAAGLWRAGEAASRQVDRQERRLIVQAFVVGVAVWAIVMVLKQAAHWGFHGLVVAMDRAPHIALILVPLVVGAVIVATIAHFGRSTVHFRDADGKIHELNTIEGDGLERAIALYFSSEPSTERALLGVDGVRARWQQPTLKLALQKLLATFVTLCTGGSGGLEASVTLIGESTSAALFKPRRFLTAATKPVRILDRLTQWWQSTRPEDLQVAQLCGISAAIATLLGTPFFAAFFAVEVMYRRRPMVEKLIYALISALVAFFLAHMVGEESAFHADAPTFELLYDPSYYGALLAVALTISVIGIGFAKLRTVLDHAFHDHLPNIWARHVVGALLTGIVAIIASFVLGDVQFGEHSGAGAVVALVLGSGESVIEAAVLGELGASVALVVLFAKLVATLTTITSGGSAGLLFPTMFFGTTTAVVFASVFGFSEPLVLIAPALTASLVSIANVPLAAILIVVELFGASWIVPALFMVVVVSIVRHDNGIYRTQHDTFDRHEILPGVAVHHLDVPPDRVGSSLAELDVRRRFGLTVVAIKHRAQEDLEVTLDLNPDPDQPLVHGDQIVAVGDDDGFEAWAREEG